MCLVYSLIARKIGRRAVSCLSVARVYDTDELKQRLLHHGRDQSITDSAVDEWRGRLRADARVEARAWTVRATVVTIRQYI